MPTSHPLSPISPSTSPPPLSNTDILKDAPTNQQGTVPLISPISHTGGSKGSKRVLGPIRPGSGGFNKAMSASVDTHLDSRTHQIPILPSQDPRFHSNISRHEQSAHPPVLQHHSSEFSRTNRPGMGSWSRRSHDIQALMKMPMPFSPYRSVRDIPNASAHEDAKGSTTSVDIKHELFVNERAQSPPQYNDTQIRPQGEKSFSSPVSRVLSPTHKRVTSPNESRAISLPGNRVVSSPNAISPPNSRVVSPHGNKRALPDGQYVNYCSPDNHSINHVPAQLIKSSNALNFHPNYDPDQLEMSQHHQKYERHHRSTSAHPISPRNHVMNGKTHHHHHGELPSEKQIDVDENYLQHSQQLPNLTVSNDLLHHTHGQSKKTRRKSGHRHTHNGGPMPISHAAAPLSEI